MGEHKATLTWRGERGLAETLLDAISPDDPDAFEARLEEGSGGVLLVIETTADSIGSLRATLDDLLACLSAAESAVRATDDEN